MNFTIVSDFDIRISNFFNSALAVFLFTFASVRPCYTKSMSQYIVKQLFFWRDCRAYGVGLWGCPSFLFLVMGFLTIGSILASFVVGREFVEPEIVFPIVVFAGMAVFVPGSIVVRNFDRIAQENRLKSEFVSIASHQLRSPLSSVKWVADIFLTGRAGKMTARQKNYLKMIYDYNENMIRLVNDLLNTSRIDKGELKLKREPLDLANLVGKEVVEKRTFARANNAALIFKPPQGKIYISGDEIYVSLVAANLIDNAIRYTDGGGTVKARIFTKDGFVRCEVQDNGVGIPKSEQRFIFRKFFRAKNAFKYQTEGTGLGLFVSRAVIKQLNGRMGFESQEGKGSTFWFELPLAR